jgi:peptide/nickel transport system substrate-binding protein
MRIARPSLVITALALTGATTITACTTTTSSTQPTGPGGSFGTIPAAAAGPQHNGVITWAETPDSGPTWIMPIVPSAAFSASDVTQFDFEMWRPLYWFDNGVQPVQAPAMSLAYAPKWSNGDRTVTITLKSDYKWSDGQPVSSRDVLFFYDEVKVAVSEDPANWGYYTPGLGFPDEVANVTTPTASTVVFTMKKAVNPEWFLEDELASVSPMPAHAWAKASGSGPILDFTVAANATRIYAYLSKESMSLRTYAANPLWQVVDGPYRLTSFDAGSGAYTLTPNPSYGGSHAAKVSALQAVPFASVTAEFDAVRTGSVDVGYLPLIDISQAKTVESGGYNVFGYQIFGFNDVPYNFADATGDFDKVIAQLYVRQALAHLEDEQSYIKAFFDGAASPAYGPIPEVPRSPFIPADAETDPYPFSVPAAISLLRSHGWMVNTTGTDTCAKAGSGPGECGAGIPAGTRLSFNLIYVSELPAIKEMVTAFASEAASAGITINLQSQSGSYIAVHYYGHTSTVDKWAMLDFGGLADSVYPTTLGIFNGTGPGNVGSYNDPRANALIDASVTSGSPAAVKAEASYLTEDQPGLFQPLPDMVAVWKKSLSGPPASFAALTQVYVNPEYWWFTG